MDLTTRSMLREMMPERRRSPSPYMAEAEVTAVIGDTAYLRLPGTDVSIPADTAEVTLSKGDTAMVDVSHAGVKVKSNLTSPAASVKHVDQVMEHKVSEVYKTISAEYADVKELAAEKAKIGRLEALFADIGDLDVDRLSAIDGTIENLETESITIKNNLTSVLASLYGHTEYVLEPLLDGEGNEVLDSTGSVVYVYRPRWVADTSTIAERLSGLSSGYASLAQSEAALSEAQGALSDAVAEIGKGLKVEEAEDGKVTVSIGAPDESTGFVVSDDALTLVSKEGGSVRHKATMTSEAFVVENLEAQNYLKLGRFAFKPRLDGGLSFQWIGG